MLKVVDMTENIANTADSPIELNLQPDTNGWLVRPGHEILDGFGAGEPAPGSGSAAALMAMLAAKLIITVCIKSKQWILDPQKLKEFDYVHKSCHEHFDELRRIFEKDAVIFRNVIELKQKAEGAPDSKTKTRIKRQANDLLETATDHIFEISDIGEKLASFALSMFQGGWAYVRGDSGAAMSSAIASITSGAFIINLNLKILKERHYAHANAKRVHALNHKIESLQKKAFGCVTSLNTEAVNAMQSQLLTLVSEDAAAPPVQENEAQ